MRYNQARQPDAAAAHTLIRLSGFTSACCLLNTLLLHCSAPQQPPLLLSTPKAQDEKTCRRPQRSDGPRLRLGNIHSSCSLSLSNIPQFKSPRITHAVFCRTCTPGRLLILLHLGFCLICLASCCYPLRLAKVFTNLFKCFFNFSVFYLVDQEKEVQINVVETL